MKILHTADLHLKEISDLDILQIIIDTAHRENAELIIIAGDLFDRRISNDLKEYQMEELWESYKGSVLVIPGNHDFQYLKGKTNLAANVVIANKTPFSIAEISGIYFVCVPYQCNRSLSDITVSFCDPSILVTHGTFAPDSYAKNNFIINTEDVSGRYRYVALGHNHSWCDRYINDCLIVNPGSPAQISANNEGIHYVSILDTNSWIAEKVMLPISFLQSKNIILSISDSPDDVKKKLLKSALILEEHEYIHLSFVIKGSIIADKDSLVQQLQCWRHFLSSQNIDIARIRWDLTQLMQISAEIVDSEFIKALVHKISDLACEESQELVRFLFERLQRKNQKYLE